ncbi:MAG: ABC transporter permease, partial [Pelagibacteraceae bacterium]|nr:ABC transporter permease [Pelagibacteraceae bacterium]
MTVYILQRTLQSFVVLFVMSLIVFCGVNLIGDPIYMMISPESEPAEIERVIKEFGFDRPVLEQYWFFLKNVASGDFGRSFVQGIPALPLILERFPATIELAVFSLFISLVIALPLGVYAGLYPERKSSKIIMSGSILGFSMPTFWVGIMLIMLFAVKLDWLPSTGRGELGTFLGIE